MPNLIIRNGLLLRSHTGLLTTNPNCCCGSDCCGGTFCDDHPTLYLHLTNVSGCACIDGMCIELTCENGVWSGTGDGPAGGDCSADEGIWQFLCESNPDGGLTDCFDFKLVLLQTGISCVMNNNGYPSDCDCTGPWWEYDFDVAGVSCCDSFSGSGTFTARVDTTPC